MLIKCRQLNILTSEGLSSVQSTAYHLMKPWSLNSFKQYRDQTFGVTEGEESEARFKRCRFL